MDKDHLVALNDKLQDRDAVDVIRFFLQEYQGKIGFATSLGLEDQIITEMIANIDKSIPVFTLDTGRMFPETYDLIHRTSKRYQIQIDIYFPDAAEVEKMVNQKGINLFYESIEYRKQCCHIRKIVPLRRALSGLSGWICGLRREQSPTREAVQIVEWDEANGLLKINPLANWTIEEVWEYVHAQKIPYNPLHDQGFASIGCQPCTRAIMPGEDIRSGRWWWEDPQSKECGLHKRD